MMLNIAIEKSKKPLHLKISNRNALHKTIRDENGDFYTGLWKDGKKHGFGTQEWTKDQVSYKGSWEDGRRHGEGILYRANTLSEFVCKGEWKKDRRNGQGINCYEDGGRYEGEWKKDKRNGYGQMDYGDGSTYIGPWKRDQRSGFGKMWYSDGATYEGYWDNDMRHGEEKGDKYDGFWENDLKHGEGKYNIKENGLEFTGLWINNDFCCGVLEVENPAAPGPMKLQIPKVINTQTN
ncbi:unnamed protein product [Larinioides sclopetarius]|uniref:MORN repeat-containing protein 3 n=1 Tax=Larinioides sclopetarius TaxID=280406 RepID=A0AAV2ANE4_9ARAC